MAYVDLTPDGSEKPDFSKFMEFFGPGHIDGLIRQAIQSCWMTLPNDKKNPDELEFRLRHVFDRALTNFRDDFKNLTPSQSSETSSS